MNRLEVLQIDKERLRSLSQEFDNKFRGFELKLADPTQQMGKWLEAMLGIFPGLNLPKDRTILQDEKYTKFDGYSPLTEFSLKVGKDPKQNYIKGYILMPYKNDPESGIEVNIVRGAKGQKIIGEFDFSPEGDFTGGSITSELITEGRNISRSFIRCNGQAVLKNVESRMGKAVKLGDRISIPKILNELTTEAGFGRVPNDVKMMKKAKLS
jgi:hypothetical protein